MQKTEYTKLRTKILGIIEGLTLSDPKYFNVRKVLIYSERIHCNTRKDGTPEFSHQLEMLSIAISMHSLLLKPYDVYMGILVHDTIEDYPLYQQEIQQIFPEAVDYSRRLSKFTDDDTSKTYYAYFDQLSKCEVCSIVKMIDRIHNLSTAPGVFSTTKISEYCTEVDMYFIDMFKAARSEFNQREAYEVLKFMLSTQVRTIRKFLVMLEPTGESS